MFILLYSRDGRTNRHQLAPGDTIVGRAPICDLQIDDPSISRRHVRFRVHGDHCVLTDLGGRNGTFVNGEQVTEREVQPGDAVVLGRFPLRVDRAAPEPVVLSDNHSIVQPERLMARPVDEPVATQPGVTPVVTVDRLTVLLESMAAHLTHWRSPADLAERIVTVAFTVLPIDRAFLLIVDETTGELRPRVCRTRDGLPFRATLNRAIVRRALQEGDAIFGVDAAFDSHQGADTGHHPSPRSFICTPLPGRAGMLGVLIVDHPDASALSPADFEVGVSLARHAAGLLDHAANTWRSFAETRLRDRLLLHHPPAHIERLMDGEARADRRREADTHDVTVLAAAVSVRDRHALGAQAVLLAVTQVFNLLCDAAFAEGGSLVRFDGDIAVFVFGGAVAASDHADAALRAAEAGLRSAPPLSGGPDVSIRIALDTGPALVATIDAAGRHEPVIVGDVLPIALSAAGTRAADGLILLTSRTRSRLSGSLELDRIGPLGTKRLELFGLRVQAADDRVS
jgi:class 3 adenylate cyclase